MIATPDNFAHDCRDIYYGCMNKFFNVIQFQECYVKGFYSILGNISIQNSHYLTEPI